jgi:hypothetical protein
MEEAVILHHVTTDWIETTNTPFELITCRQIDRFNLTIQGWVYLEDSRIALLRYLVPSRLASTRTDLATARTSRRPASATSASDASRALGVATDAVGAPSASAAAT